MGNTGMRPERRLKPGMDGDPRVALLVSPQQALQRPFLERPLRTPEPLPTRRRLPIFKTKVRGSSSDWKMLQRAAVDKRT